MHFGRCLFAVFLVLIVAVTARTVASNLPSTDHTDCRETAAEPIDCAETNRSQVAPASPSARVISLWGGARESIALKSDGTVWTWG